MAKLSITDVKDYLCIDFTDDATDRLLNRLMETADAYLKSSIGEAYPEEDPKAKQIALMLISDLYDNRGVNENTSSNTRKLIDDMSLQLRLELRRATDEQSETDQDTET
ncbi:MAG: head-tail connector protein [Parabacteroides sp.]|nr:head-tail connector protein [Parabacteroides sp.]